MRTVKIIVHQ